MMEHPCPLYTCKQSLLTQALKQFPYPPLRADALSRVTPLGFAASSSRSRRPSWAEAGWHRTGSDAEATGCHQRPGGASGRSLPDSSRAPGVSILSPRRNAARAITEAEMGVVTRRNAAMRIAL
jgi:hypothetical protein